QLRGNLGDGHRDKSLTPYNSITLEDTSHSQVFNLSLWPWLKPSSLLKVEFFSFCGPWCLVMGC
ncbi:hypothetical protein V4Y02_23880, partial [Escherichia coli]